MAINDINAEPVVTEKFLKFFLISKYSAGNLLNIVQGIY